MKIHDGFGNWRDKNLVLLLVVSKVLVCVQLDSELFVSPAF